MKISNPFKFLKDYYIYILFLSCCLDKNTKNLYKGI
ncbi:hypothetical protein NT05LM_2555, partial [Listeria marthii FSL S4-120]